MQDGISDVIIEPANSKKRLLNLRFNLVLLTMFMKNCMLNIHNTEGPLLTSLEFRQAVARAMIGNFCSIKYALPYMSMTKKRIHSIGQKQCLPSHIIIKETSRKRCVQCAKSGVENRTNNVCNIHMQSKFVLHKQQELFCRFSHLKLF